MKNKQARQNRKAARQTARAERKLVKVENRQERKNTKVAGGRRALKAKAAASENARLDTAANIENKMKQDAQAAEISRLAQIEAAQEAAAESGAAPAPEQQLKAKKYLQRRGVVGVYKDPELLAAQLMDARYNQIQERIDAEREEVMNDISIPDEEKETWIPDEEDIHDEILEEEFFDAQFNNYDGESADYLDADTIGLLYNTGAAALDKYKQKQWAKNPNKKILGQTKKEYDAKRAASAAGDTVYDAAVNKATEEVKKQKIKEYTPLIIGGVVVLVLIVIGTYYAGKKS